MRPPPKGVKCDTHKPSKETRKAPTLERCKNDATIAVKFKFGFPDELWLCEDCHKALKDKGQI